MGKRTKKQFLSTGMQIRTEMFDERKVFYLWGCFAASRFLAFSKRMRMRRVVV